ncbi:MAG: hypothetical protein RLZZ352_547 [Pseudomonadota bacterium]|jgi:hypothetical protein
MKSTLSLSWFGLCLVGLGWVSLWAPASVQAQERIYRCGNEYTNNAEVAKSRGCPVMEGGNITIVQGTSPQRNTDNRPAANPSNPPASTPTAPRPATDRVAPAEQRARDSDARTILEAELRRAEDRLAQAQKDFANGEPEKQGIETRNHQRYLDRVADLRAAVSRAQSDVDGLRRELTRLGVTPPAAPPAAPATAPAR